MTSALLEGGTRAWFYSVSEFTHLLNLQSKQIEVLIGSSVIYNETGKKNPLSTLAGLTLCQSNPLRNNVCSRNASRLVRCAFAVLSTKRGMMSSFSPTNRLKTSYYWCQTSFLYQTLKPNLLSEAAECNRGWIPLNHQQEAESEVCQLFGSDVSNNVSPLT